MADLSRFLMNLPAHALMAFLFVSILALAAVSYFLGRLHQAEAKFLNKDLAGNSGAAMHELRTPLNGLFGMLWLLKEGRKHSSNTAKDEHQLIEDACQASHSLLKAIDKLTPTDHDEPPATAVPVSSVVSLPAKVPARSAHVLVAEDHSMNQALIEKMLKHLGIPTVEIAGNGEKTVERYTEQFWDIILMDCRMPCMDGYEATRKIRQIEHGTGRHIPIIAVTTEVLPGDRERCLKSGMDDHVAKPVVIEVLRQAMGPWIDFSEPNAERTSLADAEKPVDLTIVKNFSQDDTEMERHLIQLFVEQSDININTLKESIATDPNTWREHAHMLKGGASGVGAQNLYKLCSEAQHFKGAAEDRLALFVKINAEYDHVKSYLREINLLS